MEKDIKQLANPKEEKKSGVNKTIENPIIASLKNVFIEVALITKFAARYFKELFRMV